jgi:hypothetical protein
MGLRVEEGGEYCGERYVFCDAHPLSVKRYQNNGYGTGEIFEGTSPAELLAFLAEHEQCPTP